MGLFIITILAIVGFCFIAGALTRNTDDSSSDRDHPFITIMRGLGVLFIISPILTLIICILYFIF